MEILRNKIPDEILKDCEERRRRALIEADERRMGVESARPEIAELRRARIKNAYDLSMQLSEAKTDDEKAALKADTAKKNSELSAREGEILAELGLSPDYLKPQFSCPVCEDTGFVGTALKQPCGCIKQRALQLRFASSNLENGEYFETHDPNIFRDAAQRKRHEAIMDYARRYADSIPYCDVPNMLLMGPSGLGKSFIMNCIGHRAIERGLTVVKVTAYNLIRSTLESMRRNETPHDYSDVDLLLLDDLGTEPDIRNITNEQLFAVINERYVQFKNTVISTNLEIDELQEVYGERLFSRIISRKHTRAIRLEGDDLRIIGG